MDVRENAVSEKSQYSRTSIRTHSGHLFDPWEPNHEDFNPDDLGHHLANECRFAGATKWHYSVAQHSVLVSLHPRLTSRGTVFQLCGLLHDSSEAYIKDIPSPQKSKWGGYKECEKGLMKFIYGYFKIPEELLDAPIIKEVDKELFDEERNCLFRVPSTGASSGPWGIIRPWDREYARDAFNARLAELR